MSGPSFTSISMSDAFSDQRYSPLNYPELARKISQENISIDAEELKINEQKVVDEMAEPVFQALKDLENKLDEEVSKYNVIAEKSIASAREALNNLPK